MMNGAGTDRGTSRSGFNPIMLPAVMHEFDLEFWDSWILHNCNGHNAQPPGIIGTVHFAVAGKYLQ